MNGLRPVKRIVLIILAAALLLTFASCTKAGGPAATGEPPKATDAATNDPEGTSAPEPSETADTPGTPEASVTPGPESTEPAGTPGATPTEEPAMTKKTSPGNGSTVSLLSDGMTTWLADYKKMNFPENWEIIERCEPVPVTFSWDCEGADYTNLFISKNSDMSDADAYLTLDQYAVVEDLLPGTEYYWQTVSFAGGEKIRSEVRSFRTLDLPRTVYIPGVSNARDLGGKTAAGGKKIAYGKVYRGADFANITSEGIKKAVDVLGIRTELDLRSRVKNGKSTLGNDINYVSVTAPFYIQIGVEEFNDDLIDELRVFCDPANFPVYFHCSLGRDRTGTLAMLLLALAGVSEEDIYKDYEISFFSDFGGYNDSATAKVMIPQVEKMFELINADKTLSLAENTANFLIKAGLTQAELDQIRTNLLEG